MEQSGKLLSEMRGRILLLTISNPGARNALVPPIWTDGLEAIKKASKDPAVGAVILTGAEGHFSSGGNLNRIKENRGKPQSVAHEGLTQLHDWIRAIRGCPKPVIAAVEGSAAGAGFSVALACDLIVAAEDARIFVAHVKIGISPDGGVSGSLARSLPPHLLAELLLEGGTIDAARLNQFGIVNRVCARGQALQTALDWAGKLAQGPPQAMGRIKQLVEKAYSNDLSSQLDLERQLVVESIFGDECGEGIAAFFAKRPPVFVKGGS
jgi:enoyl-CoA hydratase/carnithine racemase